MRHSCNAYVHLHNFFGGKTIVFAKSYNLFSCKNISETFFLKNIYCVKNATFSGVEKPRKSYTYWHWFVLFPFLSRMRWGDKQSIAWWVLGREGGRERGGRSQESWKQEQIVFEDLRRKSREDLEKTKSSANKEQQQQPWSFYGLREAKTSAERGEKRRKEKKREAKPICHTRGGRGREEEEKEKRRRNVRGLFTKGIKETKNYLKYFKRNFKIIP